MELEAIIKPMEIEEHSMATIDSEMKETSFSLEELVVVKRVIHTTADFDYQDNLVFHNDAMKVALKVFRKGACIITDTQMAKSGINKTALRMLDCDVHCFMTDKDVAKDATRKGTTRAIVSIDKAVIFNRNKPIVFVIGNAPTALIRLRELYEKENFKPDLIIGVPVGFFNVVQSKERMLEIPIPSIIARGRKGGSNVAAAICNAIMYQLYDRKTGKLVTLSQ